MIFLPPGFFYLYIVYNCVYIINSLIVSHNILRIDLKISSLHSIAKTVKKRKAAFA